METQVPETFTDIADADLADVLLALGAEFDAAFAAEAPLAGLTEIADAIDAVTAETDDREVRAKEDAVERKALAERMAAKNAKDDADDEEVDAEADAEAEVVAEAEAIAADAPQAVTAAAAPSASAIRRTAPAVVAPPAEASGMITITAAADVPGVPSGSSIDRFGVAKAMHARARGLADKSPRLAVASVATSTPSEFVIGEKDDATEIMDAAVASQLSGQSAQSLVASGGWCTPSETMYDQFSVESRDGLVNMPTVGINRGGIQVPSYFGLSAVDAALWTWTEGVDEGGAKTVSDLDVLSNEATATVTDHGFYVGLSVDITNASVPALNGTYIIDGITNANVFTFPIVAADTSDATATAQAVKGCLVVPCPTWTPYRLEAEGLCLSHGNLMDRSYPELTTRFVDLTMTGHLHKLSNAKVSKVLATATAVTVTSAPSDAAGDVLNAIDLQVADYRSEHLMGDNVVLDAWFPQWVKGAIRSTLAMRNGVSMLEVTDAQIIGYFTMRQVRPQFLAGYGALYSGTPALVWPSTLQFALMVTGSYVVGEGPEINLGVQRDSTLNKTNDFTLAWSEQTYQVIQRGPDAREITVSTSVNGASGGFEFAGA
jgi:hypothetical protein